MRILVTGGAGFIGSNFLHYWTKSHPKDEIINLDSLTYAGNLENLHSLKDHAGYRFVKGDITDPDVVSRAMDGCELVVHFAAESHVDRSILGPHVFVTTNVLGSQILFDCAREQKVRKFIHVSTDEVYGSLGATGKFNEKSPYSPNNPYSASKAAADLLALSYWRTFEFPVIITHCSNNYGPYQFPEKLIPLFTIRAMEGKNLPLYGDGSNIRDWIHVDDHCRGIDLAIEKGKLGESYGFGGGCERSNLQIALRICEILGRDDSLINFVPGRPGHDQRYAIDYSKAKSELGFTPSDPIEDVLPDIVQWYIDQEDWWRRILSGDYREFHQSW